jgi:hypothetical protein
MKHNPLPLPAHTYIVVAFVLRQLREEVASTPQGSLGAGVGAMSDEISFAAELEQAGIGQDGTSFRDQLKTKEKELKSVQRELDTVTRQYEATVDLVAQSNEVCLSSLSQHGQFLVALF